MNCYLFVLWTWICSSICLWLPMEQLSSLIVEPNFVCIQPFHSVLPIITHLFCSITQQKLTFFKETGFYHKPTSTTSLLPAIISLGPSQNPLRQLVPTLSSVRVTPPVIREQPNLGSVSERLWVCHHWLESSVFQPT